MYIWNPMEFPVANEIGGEFKVYCLELALQRGGLIVKLRTAAVARK